MAHDHTLVAGDAVAITPTDGASHNLVGIYVGTTGDVAVVTDRGTTVTFKTVPAGAIIPLAIRTVNATNTTASNIVGLRT